MGFLTEAAHDLSGVCPDAKYISWLMHGKKRAWILWGFFLLQGERSQQQGGQPDPRQGKVQFPRHRACHPSSSAAAGLQGCSRPHHEVLGLHEVQTRSHSGPVPQHINIQCIQQVKCISSFSLFQRRPVELCRAMFVPLSKGRHFAWHLMGSEVCTKVSAVQAPRKGPSTPLVCGPCAMAVCVRATPFWAFNLLQLFLPDLWTPLTYPSDIYPWRAGTVPLAFPLPSPWSFLGSPWTPTAGCEAAVGYPHPRPGYEEDDALPSPGHCSAGQFDFSRLSRGFTGVPGGSEELFQPNPVEPRKGYRCQQQA